MLELQSPEQAAQWLRAQGSGALVADSRRVSAGDGFIAWPGAVNDARAFVAGAFGQGAQACLIEREGAEEFQFPDNPHLACYRGLKQATGPIADAYYEHPSRQLDVLAVTGTNGKTSSAWWLAQSLGRLPRARPCGLIGTLGVGTPGHMTLTGLTTPDPVLLQQTLRRFADQGFVACAIEASSIGLAERRLTGTQIRVAVFTNFTQDHLDYHGSMAAYWQAKRELFDWSDLAAAVVNVDDERGAELAAELRNRPELDLWTVSMREPARLSARALDPGQSGLSFEVAEGAASHRLQTGLIGQYNVSNLLGVLATLRALDIPLEEAVSACAALEPVPGRMECIGQNGQPLVAVDYAHTPDALDQALRALRPLAERRGGQLWCVFGCGGERDASKRPLMAAVAEKTADRVLVTSDNPRGEKPEHIISQILRGFTQPQAAAVQADRAAAIAQAVAQADARDVLLIAGKGHEDYQEAAGVRTPFDDRVHARAQLALRAARGGQP